MSLHALMRHLSDPLSPCASCACNTSTASHVYVPHSQNPCFCLSSCPERVKLDLSSAHVGTLNEIKCVQLYIPLRRSEP